MQVIESECRQQFPEIALSFLDCLVANYHPRDFEMRLWDGKSIAAEPGQSARFTLVINSPAALREMFRSPSELSLGEAYIYNDLEIEGDVEAAFRFAQFLIRQKFSVTERLRLAGLFRKLPSNDGSHHDEIPAPLIDGRIHSRERDRAAVRYHYDTSNEFFSLFLGKTMIYSEAYFEDGEHDLDRAQERQLDRICRALRLKQGERLLDIGCGWGSLIIHAVRNYGVKALGITLSQHQAELANRRIQEEGIGDSCNIEIRDYRDMDSAAAFDKISSIGMFEHVGRKMLAEYFQRACRLLRPGGVLMNSGISRPVDEPAKRPGSFIDKYVFPDGELIPVGEVAQEAENAGFEVRWVENLREQYGLTLRNWLSRLEQTQDDARRLAGDITYRIWRLYMAGSAARFFAGKLNTYQTLLVKRGA